MNHRLVWILCALVAGCGGSGDSDSGIIANGSQVSVHLTMIVDGEITQSTRGGDPVLYLHGAGQIFPLLEAGLVGLRAGDGNTVVLPPEDAYGEKRPDAFRRLSRVGFDAGGDLVLGKEIRGELDGGPFRGWVTEIDEDSVTVNLDHPFAGKNVTIEAEIVDVRALPLP